MFYMLSKFSSIILKSIFEILLETLSGFVFKLSSKLFKTFCSSFSLGFSSRPFHESRDKRSHTGVEDAKKFHRELKQLREEQEVKEEQGQKISDAQTRNTMPPW